ncbi:MAG: nucleotidyltransferase domain-containing protein [Nitrospiraceae bacterium]
MNRHEQDTGARFARAYPMTTERLAQLQAGLSRELDKESEVTVAYLYGSCLSETMFHDVDVGLYLHPSASGRSSSIAAELEDRLSSMLGLPVDIRVLNEAPVTFVYHVLRGSLLLCRDERFLSATLEDVARRYLDLAPLLRRSTAEAFAG